MLVVLEIASAQLSIASMASGEGSSKYQVVSSKKNEL